MFSKVSHGSPRLAVGALSYLRRPLDPFVFSMMRSNQSRNLQKDNKNFEKWTYIPNTVYGDFGDIQMLCTLETTLWTGPGPGTRGTYNHLPVLRTTYGMMFPLGWVDPPRCGESRQTTPFLLLYKKTISILNRGKHVSLYRWKETDIVWKEPIQPLQHVFYPCNPEKHISKHFRQQGITQGYFV